MFWQIYQKLKFTWVLTFLTSTPTYQEFKKVFAQFLSNICLVFCDDSLLDTICLGLLSLYKFFATILQIEILHFYQSFSWG